MQGVMREFNVYATPGSVSAAATDSENAQMSKAELQEELTTREKLMQKLRDREGVWTDQWRVYQEIITALGANTAPLRLFLQASAGTGKSFLLETVFIWCALNGHCAEAAAPTGSAAARLRVKRTPVFAYTLHYLFGLSVDLEESRRPKQARR